jgi:tetratricopeptide (TPR) repeat protein
LEDHPSAADFKGFLEVATGQQHIARNRKILRHLLGECPICRRQLQLLGWAPSRLARLLSEQGETELARESADEIRYAAAFQGAQEALAQFLAQPPEPVVPLPDLIEALLAIPVDRRHELLESDGRFAAPQLVDWLIEKSHETRYSEPVEMLGWARLGRDLGARCTAASAGGPARLEDLRARAWRQYGNALRVAGQLRESEDALRIAADHLAKGTGDPNLKARHAEQLASLYYIQRRYPEAISQTGEAAAIYRELGERHALARAFVTEAIACLYSGDAEGAIRRLNQATPLIDHQEDPHLLLAACHNLVSSYIELDRPEEALALYLEIKDLYQESNDPLFRLRYSWQEGQLLRNLGELRAAEQILQLTRASYMERGLTVEAAEVSLDLAAVYVKLKASDDLKETVAATAVIFKALGMDRDALASLLQLQQVAHEEQEALELVRTLAAQLESVAKRSPIRS